MPITAGFTALELPVPPHGYLAGYAVSNRYAHGTAHPLTATIARFETDDRRTSPATDCRRTPAEDGLTGTIVWIGIDVLAIPPALRTAIRASVRRHLPDSVVLVSATHTHSAPGAWCGTIHPLLPAQLDTTLIDRIARRIGDALPAPAPVDLVRGTASATGVGANRDDPALPFDTSVGVLAALHDGRPIGLLVNHACHPTVLGPDSTLWSPDWVAGLRAGLADTLDAPVLFLQGAAADVSTRFTRRESTTTEAERIGRLVAAAALSALASATPVDQSPGIRVERHTLTLHRRDAADELRRLDADAVDTDADRIDGPGAVARSRREGLAGLRALAAHPGPPSLKVPISDVRIGSARYLALPFELQNAWGQELSTAGGLRIAGYTDGYLGYLADSAAHAKCTYEATSSYADAPESESLMAQMRRIADPQTDRHPIP